MRIARLLLPLWIPVLAIAQGPRTPDGHPDLSGTYDITTLTPVTRPARYGTQKSLSDEEAKAQAKTMAAKLAEQSKASDPNRQAPAKGGARPAGVTGDPEAFEAAAGNVGGYNAVWVEFGSQAFKLEGRYRTSIIVDPPDGKAPPMTPQAMQRLARNNRALFAEFGRPNRGDAWWIKEGISPGPYDDPELRPLAERCLMSFGQSPVTPALPNYFYNNLKQIVQTKDTVVIHHEMIHDARIVRMNGKHAPPELRFWAGDSIGHWEGEVLVVDTTNFRDEPVLQGSDRNLHVIERFSRIDAKTLLYQFTVEDPTVWTKPWSGEMPWPATDGRIFEYACHEGNYSFGNILRGARLLEAEAMKQQQQPQQK
jgi:hypothetical protein